MRLGLAIVAIVAFLVGIGIAWIVMPVVVPPRVVTATTIITTTLTTTTYKTITTAPTQVATSTAPIHTGVTTTPTPRTTTTARPTGPVKSFTGYEELKEYLSKSGAISELYKAIPELELVRPLAVTLTIPTATPTPLPVAKAPEVGVRFSKTIVQVPGVEEADIVKTDGKYIYIAKCYGNEVVILNAYPVEEMKVCSKITLKKGTWVKGIYIHDDRLVVIASTPAIKIMIYPPYPVYTNTTIVVYDVSNKSKPKEVFKVEVTGSYMTSRMVGNYLYLVATMPAQIIKEKPIVPLINGKPLRPSEIMYFERYGNTYTIILTMNVKSGKFKVYTYITNPSNWLYMTTNNMYIISLPQYYRIMERVIRIFMEKKLLPPAIEEVVEKYLEKSMIREAISEIRKYLSTLSKEDVERINKIISEYPVPETSKIYYFRIDGLDIKFVTCTEIKGRVLDQFSMEEIGGRYFIVATTSRYAYGYVRYVEILPPTTPIPRPGEVIIIIANKTSTITKTITITPRPPVEKYERKSFVYLGIKYSAAGNNVYILSLPDLKLVSSLEGLAKGERVYAARLVGKYFFLVTFRRVDPLFAIDISNPEKPKVIGFLEMPGYSEYLHPLGKNLLLGIGVSTREHGVKLSLIDISDPRNMRELAKIVIPYSYTEALRDRHAVLVNYENSIIALPLRIYKGGVDGVAIIRYTNESLNLVKILEHRGVSRALYIDEVLYTISRYSVKAFSYKDFNLIKEIELK